MWAWIIVGTIVLLLALILLLPSKLQLAYALQQGKHKLRARLHILGIPVSFLIPLDKKDKTEKKKQKQKAEHAEKWKSPKEFVEFTKKLYDAFNEARRESVSLFGAIKQHVACTDITFAMQYGTGNPASTGILNGPVWTGATLLMKMAETTFSVENKSLTVEPVFDRSCLEIHSKLTFRFQVFRALWLLCKLKKIGQKLKIK